MNRLFLLTTLALLSGCSYFHPAPEQQKMLHYTCGTMPLTVSLDNARQEVNLILDGNPLTLKQQEAASGTRYSDGNYVFWSKGDGAFIERNDKIIINDCLLDRS
ncbi:MliC family protein [Erwinia sp. E_sp_B04_7]|uniref:MliC family protein n=1 Tax=unclassified Erwinia TaxID=2622719 RepID=UPI0030CB9CF2